MILVMHSHETNPPDDAEVALKLEKEELTQATMNPSSYRETVAMQAKESIQSWGRWSKTKAWFDVSLKNAKELAGLMVDKAGRARDSMWNTAGKGKGKMIDNTATEAKAGADGAAENAEEAAANTKEEVDGGAVQSAKKAYQQAKKRVHETYKRAKGTIKEEPKGEYEAAKEEESDATGNLGSELRKQKEEL
ncbi:hypothetical protein EJ110_NYTH09826 [Nymphaea thermarum]|nr:hypothetical protein EJ110_NYTH09826 [Nymphaea thermarum]